MKPRTVNLENGIICELWPSAAYEVDGVARGGVLGFAFQAQEGEDAIDSACRRRFLRRPNTVSWIPPGCSVYSRSPVGGEYLVMHGVPADRIGHSEATRRRITDVVDEHAISTAHLLRRLIISNAHDDVSGAVDSFASALLNAFSDGTPSAGEWLTNARLAAIERFIEAHMHENPSVAQMAAALGLSTGFLILAFRRRLGTTPHRYLMEKRLARARTMLGRRHPIAAVAAECGFADQAHLTRQMRTVLGVTPKRFSAMEAAFA
jgi:AraC family transcriptional regulator